MKILDEKIREETESGTCEKHGPFKGIARYYFGDKIGPFCPLCEEEAIKSYEEQEKIIEQNKKIEAERAAQGEFLYKCKQSNIEPEYYYASFDNFEANTEELKHNVSRMRDLVEGRIKK